METKKIIGLALLVVYAAVAFVTYSTKMVPEDMRLVVENMLYLVAPAFVFASGIYALRKYGTKSIHGRTILFIVLGYTALFIGELTWTYYEIFLGERPSPSLADVFYLSSYPFVLYGIINELKLGKILWTRKKIAESVGLVLLLWAITIYYGIYSAYDSEAALVENVASIAYGFADMIIISAVIVLMNLVLEFRGGAFSESWKIFAAGMFLFWIADMLYAIFYDAYVAGEFVYRQIDYLWLANYILVGFALLKQGTVLEEMMAKIAPKKSAKN